MKPGKFNTRIKHKNLKRKQKNWWAN